MENIKISENSKKNNISLEELSLEISKKFWLESKKISFLIKEIRENSVYSLENLKAELQKEKTTIFQTFWSQNFQENSSKKLKIQKNLTNIYFQFRFEQQIL